MTDVCDITFVCVKSFPANLCMKFLPDSRRHLTTHTYTHTQTHKHTCTSKHARTIKYTHAQRHALVLHKHKLPMPMHSEGTSRVYLPSKVSSIWANTSWKLMSQVIVKSKASSSSFRIFKNTSGPGDNVSCEADYVEKESCRNRVFYSYDSYGCFHTSRDQWTSIHIYKYVYIHSAMQRFVLTRRIQCVSIDYTSNKQDYAHCFVCLCDNVMTKLTSRHFLKSAHIILFCFLLRSRFLEHFLLSSYLFSSRGRGGWKMLKGWR